MPISIPNVSHVSRALVQKTNVDVSITGELEIWFNDQYSSSVNVTQGNYAFNPYVVGNYKFRLKDTTTLEYSDFSDVVSYNPTPHSFNPDVSVVRQVGTPIVFSFTQDLLVTGESLEGSQGFGVRVRNLDTGQWIVVASNGLTQTNTVSWTPTEIAEEGYQYDLFWGTNNVGSHFDFMVTEPLPISANPVITSQSPYYVNVPIQGTGVAGASIQVYIVGGKGDNLETTVTVASNGTWSYTPLVTGDYKFGQYEINKDESDRLPLSVVAENTTTTYFILGMTFTPA